MQTEYHGTGFESVGPGHVLVFEDGDDESPRELDAGLDNADLPSHSPDGFQCGYKGSGPAQLAAALLYDVTGDAAATNYLYQYFHDDVVAGLDREGWKLTEEFIREWIEANDDR